MLVFQDMTASLVRAGTPEQWRRMMDRGVHIAGARARWQEGRREVEPDEIRSTFWEAHKEGVHHDTIGSYLVDRLIPRRKQHEVVRDDVGLVDPGPSLEETAISDIERAAFRKALAASPHLLRRFVPPVCCRADSKAATDSHKPELPNLIHSHCKNTSRSSWASGPAS